MFVTDFLQNGLTFHIPPGEPIGNIHLQRLEAQ